jgi:rhodanese-related sulfurtransferase
VAELHSLYEKGEVLIIDTRSEIAFKESRIKGAILVPVGDVAAKADELPRNKMIVTYCT